MGYTLRIGELETTITDEGLESYINNEAIPVRHDCAPAFGEPTDYTNSRWPSYSSWADSMRFVGLHEFMFNKETGLLRRHPGCVPLMKAHKEIIDDAYNALREKYPDLKPGYSPKSTDTEEDLDWPEENGYAARLEWLKYWVDWALENCDKPVFYNS